jgi:ATP adenylyltransferase
MPVIGLTRVLPQVLRETRDLLAAAWSDSTVSGGAAQVLSSAHPTTPAEA